MWLKIIVSCLEISWL